MKQIAMLFDRMDAWRHLPNYQLERRADLLFSLYLPEVLEAKLGFPVCQTIVPEFPVHIRTIRTETENARSYKIDFIALSSSAETAILVELKTERSSRRLKQDRYLTAACEAGFTALLAGVIDIFRATESKRKYFALLELLESMGLIGIPNDIKEIMARPARLRGVTAASRSISVTTSVKDTIIVYVQPDGDGDNIVSFEDFQKVVQKHDDPLSARFAKSLSKWSRVQAGNNGA